MKLKGYIEKNFKSLSERTVAVTGAAGGIGKEICRILLTLGATLVVVDRNPKKQKALVDSLLAEFPTAEIKTELCDMEKVEDARALAERLKSHSPDALILNAGAYSIPRCKTSLGYDNVFTINYISPIVIADALEEEITSRGGKIIAVGSIAHGYSKIDKDDIDFSTRKKASLVYGNSKRYLMYTFFDRHARNPVYAVAHPGITFTGITSHYPKWIFALIKHPMKVIFMSPKKASLSILKALFAEVGENSWIGPRLFDVWGAPRIKRLRVNPDERAFAVSVSEKILSETKNGK
jgi:NAD(P)-dependent dehydrogenase (short-subunit alcohol dehydrogenase family)